MLETLGVIPRGILIGLMIAAPVGPVGLLCIRRTLQKGLWIGFLTGFGAALADFIFAGIATFGVSIILDAVRAYANIIHVIGGAFLLVVGWHTWHDKPKAPHAPQGMIEKKLGHKIGFSLGKAMKAVVSSFMITLTNPATLFGTLAVIATFGGMKTKTDSVYLVLSVFLGSSLWWGLLSGGTALIRHKLTEKSIIKINKITAALLFPVGIWALCVGLSGFLGYWNPIY